MNLRWKSYSVVKCGQTVWAVKQFQLKSIASPAAGNDYLFSYADHTCFNSWEIWSMMKIFAEDLLKKKITTSMSDEEAQSWNLFV